MSYEYEDSDVDYDDMSTPESERVCCFWTAGCPHPTFNTVPLIPVVDPDDGGLLDIHEDCLAREWGDRAEELKATAQRVIAGEDEKLSPPWIDDGTGYGG